MKKITSRSHPTVKQVLRLHNAKGRKEERLFFAEGQRTIETLMSRWQPEAIFLTEKGRATAIGQKILAGQDVTCVSDEVMHKMSAAHTPSGLLALFNIPENPSLDQMTMPAVVLAQIADPGNMGNLIRTAAAFNFSVVVVEGVDCWSPKVVQSSVGTLAYSVPFQASWDKIVTFARTKDISMYALVARDGTEFEQVACAKKSMLVVGSEAFGLQSSWVADCDERVMIFMPGRTESLNAAVAGSIGIYLCHKKLQ